MTRRETLSRWPPSPPPRVRPAEIDLLPLVVRWKTRHSRFSLIGPELLSSCRVLHTRERTSDGTRLESAISPVIRWSSLKFRSGMECLNCKADIPDGNQFCEECGTPVPILCSYCSAPVRSGAKFCGKCGNKVVTGASTAQPATASLLPSPAP